MTIRNQLLVLVAVPFVGLLILGANLLNQQTQTYLTAKSAQQSSDYAILLTDLVHALQVERGQSAGFIASKGQNFADTLPGARDATDKAFAAVSTTGTEGEFRLNQLASRRSRIDALNMTVPEMARWYTQEIRTSLELSENMLIDQEITEIIRIGTGFIALAEGKEAAGLQRAAGATGLGSGSFSPNVFYRFLELGAIETQSLHRVQLELGELLAGTDFKALQEQSGVASLRSRIIAEGVNAAPDGLTAPEWFARSTAWIEALREIELKITKEIAAQAQATASWAFWGLSLTIAVTLAVTLASVWLGWTISRSINGSFRVLQSAMQRLGNKDFDNRPRKADLKTEVGRLFAAIDETRNKLREADDMLLDSDSARVSVLADTELALSKVANRDLMCDFHEDFPEEYSGLKDAFNSAIAQLREVLLTFQESIVAVESASLNLDEATTDMSLRTNSQAASLEESNAALTELTDRVSEATSVAADASSSTRTLINEASRGREMADKTLPVMQDISKASERMASMVTLIEDIAFQTNLLALNAGVEAARAGDAGRGFAVVAGEVHSLAATAGSTATEIKSLIDETLTTVNDGVTMVEQTVNALRSIDEKAKVTIESVERVTDETKAQSLSISEIRIAINSLDEVTQQNAAMVEQCSRMARDLGKRAAETSELAGSFILRHPSKRPSVAA